MLYEGLKDGRGKYREHLASTCTFWQRGVCNVLGSFLYALERKITSDSEPRLHRVYKQRGISPFSLLYRRPRKCNKMFSTPSYAAYKRIMAMPEATAPKM